MALYHVSKSFLVPGINKDLGRQKTEQKVQHLNLTWKKCKRRNIAIWRLVSQLPYKLRQTGTSQKNINITIAMAIKVDNLIHTKIDE